MLKDGQWHMLEEIQEKTNLTEDQIQQIVAFLKEYRFIIMNETRKELRLEESVRRFLAQNATA
jgi:Spy/CpxP family protein refolding chaperone